MNARERFVAIMNFDYCDRTLNWEFGYWAGAVHRWYQEGLPKKVGLPKELQHTYIVRGPGLYWPAGMGTGGVNVYAPVGKDVHAAFNFDKGHRRIPLNTWSYPPFERKVLEENEETQIVRDEWGVTQRLSKDSTSPPGYIEWPVKNRKDWEKFKEERLQIRIKERLPVKWSQLVQEYRKRDYPLMLGGYPCGFYGGLRYLMGEVTLSTMFYDDPKLIKDIQKFLSNFWITLYSEVLAEVKPDWCLFWEDMAYKTGSLISPKHFREFLSPYYKKVTSFLKANEVNIIHVDSDGNVWELIPLWLEAGITGVYPMEVNAGMDIVKVRRSFPNLQILGGVDKMLLARGKKEIDKELTKIPYMIRKGGYIPYCDHAVPEDIPWKNFKYYRQELWKIIQSTPCGVSQ